MDIHVGISLSTIEGNNSCLLQTKIVEKTASQECLQNVTKLTRIQVGWEISREKLARNANEVFCFLTLWYKIFVPVR